MSCGLRCLLVDCHCCKGMGADKKAFSKDVLTFGDFLLNEDAVKIHPRPLILVNHPSPSFRSTNSQRLKLSIHILLSCFPPKPGCTFDLLAFSCSFCILFFVALILSRRISLSEKAAVSFTSKTGNKPILFDFKREVPKCVAKTGLMSNFGVCLQMFCPYNYLK